MKTIFTLLLATIFTTGAFAYQGGKIVVTVANKNNVQLYVDGRAYEDMNNSFELSNVQPGNHTIAIYRTGYNNGNGYGKNSRNDSRNGNLIYSSTVYVRPSYQVNVVVNSFGQGSVNEQAIQDGSYSRGHDRDGDDDRYDRNYGGYDRNGGYNNGGYDNNSNHRSKHHHRRNNDNDGYNNDNNYGGYDRNGGYQNGNYGQGTYGVQAMNDYDFNSLVQKIRSTWFGKMGKAKDALNHNYFSTYQVRTLLQIFSSEDDKLELAKISYQHIVDRQNFRQLYDLFSYRGQSELDTYIHTSRY